MFIMVVFIAILIIKVNRKVIKTIALMIIIVAQGVTDSLQRKIRAAGAEESDFE
jgi:hypothetical protein